jgi:GTPase SAR1 family protein
MGIVASMIADVLGRIGTIESRILVLGLDAAGKTTLVSS